MENKNNDFNKLLNLQILIKKEFNIRSVFDDLKEKILCEIEKKIKEYFEKLIVYLEKYFYFLQKNLDKKHNKINDEISFPLNNYLMNFFKNLDFFYYFYYEIILSCNFKDLEFLGISFSNLFFNNVFNDFDEKYFLLVCELIKNNKIENLFSLLKGEIFKNENRKFLKNIFKNVIEKIEIESCDYQLEISLYKINEIFNENEEKLMKILKKKKLEKFKEIFFKKYFDKNLNKFHLEKIVKEFDEKNSNEKSLFKVYLMNQINSIKNGDENKYNNKIFCNNLNNFINYEDLLDIYSYNFIIITKIIEIIIENLNENVFNLPKSLKIICAIYSKLYENKFEKMKKISEFLFKLIFKYFIDNFEYNILFIEYPLSKTTEKNLKLIYSIFEQFVSFDFYDKKNSEFTLFNLFFIENFEKIEKFFEKIDFDLPEFLTRKIENENFEEINFFELNSEEIINFKTICFSIKDFEKIFNIFNKNKEKFFKKESENLNKLKATFEKLLKQEKNVLKIKENDVEKKQTSFLLLINKEIHPNFKNVFEEKNSSFFQIENKNFSEKIKYENLLIKFLCVFNDLNDYEKHLKNKKINEIFNFLKIFANYENFEENNFINNYESFYLLECILTFDFDFESIYNELKKILEIEMKKFDFEILAKLNNKKKIIEKKINEIKNNILFLNEINLKKNINNFIYNFDINAIIVFNVGKNSFEIKENRKEFSLDDFLYENENNETENKKIESKNINEFCKKFPNFNQFYDYQDVNVFDYYESIKLNEKIEEYLKIVKNYVQKDKKLQFENSEKNDENKYYDKIIVFINSFIFSKIHKFIFPENLLCSEDINIYRNTTKLSWVAPKNFVKNQNIEADFFNECINSLKNQIILMKSPIEKITLFKKIEDKILIILKLNSVKNKDFGADDIFPLFTYVVIKSNPENLFSTMRFIEIFLPTNFKLNKFGLMIATLKAVINLILNFKWNNLIEISEEEYNKKCEEVLNNNQ